jgi:hypothetical protein
MKQWWPKASDKFKVSLSLAFIIVDWKNIFKKILYVETKGEHFLCPFLFVLMLHPISLKRVGNVYSWIIECLLMHDQDDAHAFSSNQGFFRVCF